MKDTFVMGTSCECTIPHSSLIQVNVDWSSAIHLWMYSSEEKKCQMKNDSDAW